MCILISNQSISTSCLLHRTLDVKQVCVFELDVLLLVAHFALTQQVEHVLFSQEPLEESGEHPLHLNLLFLLCSDKKS